MCDICFLEKFWCCRPALLRGRVLPHLFVFPTHRLPFLWCCFSSHPPAVTSYDATAPTPHGLGPAAPLLVALSFGHSAIFTILLQ